MTIPISKPSIGKEEISAVEAVLQSGWISQGPKVSEFEQQFAAFVGAKHACAISNCTVGLHLALLAVGVQPGDGVITVSHSFIATANAIRYCGAEPLFIDIEPTTYNMSPKALETFLSEKCLLKENKVYEKSSSKKISALLLVHQIGYPCDLKALLAIAKKYHLPVIEDAACAIGSEINQGHNWERIGKPHGLIACFSFHPRKVLSTGEGGMLTTNDDHIDHQFRLLRQHGMSVTDLQRHQAKKVLVETYDSLGYNYRMTDIQAAIGIEQLKKLPGFIQKRRELNSIYRQKLQSISWLSAPSEPDYLHSNWQSYPIRIHSNAPKTRDEIIQILFDQGIMTKPGVMNAHEEKVYKDKKWHLPESEKARREVVLLPMHSQLSESDIDRIVGILKEIK